MKMHTKMSTFLGGLGLLLLQAIGIQAQVTLNEIRMHATETDCWTAVYGEAYDVTGYAPMHPVGAAILVSNMCGKDGTMSFDQFHGDTPGYMNTFPGIARLGTLVPEPVPATPAPVPVTRPPVPATPAPFLMTRPPVPAATPAPVPRPTSSGQVTRPPSRPVPTPPRPTMGYGNSDSSSSDSDDRKKLRG